MHVFLHFGTFGLMVLQLILASKLSELEQFENFWDPPFFWLTLYITEFRVAVATAHLRPGIDITNLYTPGLISTVIAERKENQLSCWIEIRSAAVSVTVAVLWPEHHWQHPSCWQHWHPHYWSGAVTTNKDHRDLSALHMAWHGYLPKIILN